MFRNIFVPAQWFLIAVSLTWFLLKLLTYSAIKSHKKNLIWSQSGPRIGTKIGPRIGAKNWDQNWNLNWAQNWDQKGDQNLKDPFWPLFKSFFGTNFGPNFGPSFGTKPTLKSQETRVSVNGWKIIQRQHQPSVNELTKPTKPNWKIIQRQHQPSFQLLLGYQIICEKLSFKHLLFFYRSTLLRCQEGPGQSALQSA